MIDSAGQLALVFPSAIVCLALLKTPRARDFPPTRRDLGVAFAGEHRRLPIPYCLSTLAGCTSRDTGLTTPELERKNVVELAKADRRGELQQTPASQIRLDFCDSDFSERERERGGGRGERYALNEGADMIDVSARARLSFARFPVSVFTIFLAQRSSSSLLIRGMNDEEAIDGFFFREGE